MKHQTKIGDLKIPILNDYLKKRGFIHNKIVVSWPSLTNNLQNFTFPSKIKFPKNKIDDGTLFIKVKSGLGPELEMNKQNIINSINSIFGYKAIKKIKIQNGNFQNNEKEIIEPNINLKVKAKFNEKIRKIKNQDLAEALIQLGKEIPN